MKTTAFFIVIFSLLSSRFAAADAKEFYFQRHAQGRDSIDVRGIEEQVFDQRINPQDPNDPRTFKQRYYRNSQYAAGPASPVLFYLCGEATCQPTSLGGAIAEHAKAIGAHLVALEHRYYGWSQPFDKLTTENLRFLTTDNALRDAAAFQTYAETTLGLKGKWVVVGGSYPGSLSAYYRLTYPDRVVGSLASSAPVRAEANFEDFDRHVTEVVGSDCARAMRQVVGQAEAALADPQALQAFKKEFQAEALTDEVDFLYLVADMGALAAQYGYRDRFCGYLTAGDPRAGYARFTREIFIEWQMDALSGSAAGALSLDPDDYVNVFGMRQWFYQSCTEYGYWQNAHHDPSLSVRSARINAAYHAGICRRLFGIETPVDTHHINETFYEPLLKGPTSHILFTNGSQDPWSKLSITKANGNDQNPELALTTIDKAAHCDDLRTSKGTDSASLKGARAQFLGLLRQWIATAR